jgi:hypothetical protein
VADRVSQFVLNWNIHNVQIEYRWVEIPERVLDELKAEIESWKTTGIFNGKELPFLNNSMYEGVKE